MCPISVREQVRAEVDVRIDQPTQTHFVLLGGMGLCLGQVYDSMLGFSGRG